MKRQNGRSDFDFVYGVNPVMEALKAGRVKEIYISDSRRKELKKIIDRCGTSDFSVKIVDDSFFNSRFPKGHQSIAARVESKRALDTVELIEKVLPKTDGFFIVLDEIEDPRNFGAILRVADASGADGVIIQRHRQAGVGPGVIKASAGAYEFVDIAEESNIKYAINTLKEYGFRIIGADAGGRTLLWETDLTGRIGLVIGSEARGIRQTILRLCDEVIKIPMMGKINSLNVSVATGVIAFEVLRQRRYRYVSQKD